MIGTDTSKSPCKEAEEAIEALSGFKGEVEESHLSQTHDVTDRVCHDFNLTGSPTTVPAIRATTNHTVH